MVYGENGAGETTLLKLLAGLYRPLEGIIHVMGHNLLTDPPKAKQHIGYVSVIPQVVSKLTGCEYILFVAGLFGHSWSHQMTTMVQEFRLRDAIDERIQCYSLGMMQKLCLVAQLSHHPKLL